MSTDRAGAERDIETSLRNLQTDYIDIYQMQSPSSADPDDDSTALFALMQAKKAGKSAM